MNDRARRRSPIAQAISLILGTAVALPALAQTSEPLEEVVVTGIRGSLTSSMNLKRDAQGVIDGIVAEDIGKFPDTNLAESLQRISGVSIDRSSIGEGQRVTVRGVGPDFNLVLLNGRQMPASSIQDTVASDSRAFDFANLASEAIAAIEVYKTSRASTPTGGIGATINIKTARPLDNPGLHTSFGVKGVIDDSARNLPDHLQGDDDHAGSLRHLQRYVRQTTSSASRSARATRSATPASTRRRSATAGARSPATRTTGARFRSRASRARKTSRTVPMRPTPIRCRRTSATASTASSASAPTVSSPCNGVRSTRSPRRSTTPTPRTRSRPQRNELSVWFNFGPSSSTWTDGPVAGPLVYSELIPAANSDLSMGGAKFATKNENKSVGFNLAWEASDRLGFQLDYPRFER